jgi:ligand-binding SRPBCC domain-containing protein
MRSAALYERAVTMLRARDRAPGRTAVLHAETTVAADAAKTFAFFSDAGNLERLTPPWINFQIRTPLPIDMREGTIIDYQITLHGLPLPWRTRIDVWEPGVRFVDRQIAGPYLWWRHEHRFDAAADGTRVTDHVDYVPRAALLTSSIVARDVRRIFAFRQRTLAALLAAGPLHA